MSASPPIHARDLAPPSAVPTSGAVHAAPSGSPGLAGLFGSPPFVPLQPSQSHTQTPQQQPQHTHHTLPPPPPSAPSSHPGMTQPHSRAASSSGDFAHPASLTAQSPSVTPATSFGFLKSLNRGGTGAPVAPSSAAALVGGLLSTPADRSRRGSLVASMLAAESLPGTTGAAGTPVDTSKLDALRAASTSPTIAPQRGGRSPHPGSGSGRGGHAGGMSGYPSPSYTSYTGGLSDPFGLPDTPSLSGIGMPLSLSSALSSRSRFTHGLSKPFESGVSPFIGPSSTAAGGANARRSPRGSHSPQAPMSNYHSFMSPSPGMSAQLAQSHSPNISFALPSPSLMSATGGLPGINAMGLGRSAASAASGASGAGSAAVSGGRDMNGVSTNVAHGSAPSGSGGSGAGTMLQSHIFGGMPMSSWEGDALARRNTSPRITGAVTSHRGPSPNFGLFSPSGGSQQQPHVSMPLHDAGSAAAALGRRAAAGGPSMSPPLNAVPSSPNLSMLGKLRSLHAAGDHPDGGHSQRGGHAGHVHGHGHGHGHGGASVGVGGGGGDGGHAYASHQQHAHQGHSPYQHHQHHSHYAQRGGHVSVSGDKRSRHEYEMQSSPSPGPPHPQHGTEHKQGSGLPFTSPALVGSLPPASMEASHEQLYGAASGPETPSRRVPKSTLVKRERLDAQGQQPSSVSRQKRQAKMSESEEGMSSPDFSGGGGGQSGPHLSATAVPPGATAPAGQGQSCHQCKSRRLVSELVFCCNQYRKGRDKKVAPTATSSAAHSCRKKYCFVCLHKFYNSSPPSKAAAPSWPCPACRGICCCAACRRIKAKQFGDLDPTTLSPASVLAYSYVYCPDILLAAMGDAHDSEQEGDGDADAQHDDADEEHSDAASSSRAAAAQSGGKYGGGKTGKRRAEHVYAEAAQSDSENEEEDMDSDDE